MEDPSLSSSPMDQIPTIKPTDELVQEVAPGIYAGQKKIGEEIVYFGVERVESDNELKWRQYAGCSDLIGGSARGGLLKVLALSSKLGVWILFDKVKDVTGFNEQEYIEYMNKLDAVIHSRPSVVDALEGVGEGVAGFSLSFDGHHYVVYASKKPITGRFVFIENAEKCFPLKDFYESYGNLLKSVRLQDNPDTNRYSNRGIFRNPISFIEDGSKYPRISMKLHGFSAVFAKKFLKGKEYMTVRPVISMRKILLDIKGWQRGEVLINKKDLFDHSPEELD